MTFFVQFTEGVIGDPSSKFYRKYKDDGWYRIIGAPNEPMEEIQQKLQDFLRRHAPHCHSAVASKDGLGSVRNARVHAGNEFVFKLDFVNAFGNTSGRKVAEMVATRVAKFLPRGEAPSADDWHAFLAKYVLMRSGGLIQGAKTSPLLLDWYCEETVDRLIRRLLFREMGKGVVVFTRYVDDLTFSSPYRITRALRAEIRKIVAAAGYLESHRKTEVVQLGPQAMVKITGPRIGLEHFGLPRKEVKEMERMLDAQLRAPLFHPMKPEKVEGRLRYPLDVIRGKAELNALEARTIDMYRQWCEQNGKDATWPTKVLARKWLKKRAPQKEHRRRARK